MQKPAWLKSMENGSVGEARTRAFLLDQFWILERSVDVDGADFLVQVKPNQQTLLSGTVAKFGRVQSKFVQDANTVIKIKRTYLLKDDDTTRTDFFLIVNTGSAGAQKMYFLTADQIVDEYKTNSKRGEYHLRIDTNSDLYLIKDPLHTLQLIEKSINDTNFYENRANLFPELAIVQANLDDIEPDYKIDIKHNLGLTSSIPEFFVEKKKEALELMNVIIEAYQALRSFIFSTDPMAAAVIAEEIARNYSGIFGSSAQNLFDSNLYHIPRHHLDVVSTLRDDNALESYIESCKAIESAMTGFLDANSIDISNANTYRVIVNFNMSDFSIIDQHHSFVRIESSKNTEYSSDGICKLIYTDMYIASRLTSVFPYDSGNVAMKIMEKIYEVKYFEPQ